MTTVMPGINQDRSGVPADGSIYSGRRVALLTRHGKEQVIASALVPALGCLVTHVDSFDTDQLGTFTRDIPRAGTQAEAARRKARIGMDLAGLSLGLASEGSFGPDPFTGMFSWNVEMIVWIDDLLGIEVIGMASSQTNLGHRLIANWEDAEAFCRSAGFPQHGLAVRPQGEDDPHVRKGITDWQVLREAFHWACSEAENGCAFMETDMRAHVNPTRMATISLAALDLARKLCTLCPACAAPGFQLFECIPGLPCEECGAPTRETKAEIHSCPRCSHRVMVKRPLMTVSAGRCDWCNP